MKDETLNFESNPSIMKESGETKKKVAYTIPFLFSDSDGKNDLCENKTDKEESMCNEKRLVVYTDGACSGNPGPGGWAWAVEEHRCIRRSGGEKNTTNNRMEMTAVLEALRELTQDHNEPIQVVSDSRYVVDCFQKGWWKNWKKNGWVTRSNQPVLNQDLWKPLVDLVIQHNVTFVWVRGHSGDRMNDLVDSLAVNAIPLSLSHSVSSGEELQTEKTECDEKRLVVYTGGVCSKKNGPGGWAWAVEEPRCLRQSGGEKNTTIHRMEMMSVLEALRELTQDYSEPIQVVSTSRNVVDCFQKGWWKHWKENGWMTKSNQPVANQDLRKPLVDLVIQHNVTFVWVRGHSGDRMNDLVDALAVNAIPT